MELNPVMSLMVVNSLLFQPKLIWLDGLKSVPSILKAITDVYSRFGWLALVLAVVTFMTIRHVKPAGSKTSPWPSIVVFFLFIVAIVALFIGFSRTGSNNVVDAEVSRKNTAAKYVLKATVFGIHQETTTVQVPFRVSSGQFNVGCTDSANASVTWNLPVGAHDINASADWEKADDLQSSGASRPVVQGQTVTASGSIRGRDREWTGNCPGGGHGELVLTGTYFMDSSADAEKIVLSQLTEAQWTGSEKQIALSSDPQGSPSSCTIEVASGDGRHTTLDLSLVKGANGDFSSIQRSLQGPIAIDAAASGHSLEIRLVR